MPWQVTQLSADYVQKRGLVTVQEEGNFPSGTFGRTASVTFPVEDKAQLPMPEEQYLRQKAKQTLLDAATAL